MRRVLLLVALMSVVALGASETASARTCGGVTRSGYHTSAVTASGVYCSTARSIARGFISKWQRADTRCELDDEAQSYYCTVGSWDCRGYYGANISVPRVSCSSGRRSIYFRLYYPPGTRA